MKSICHYFFAFFLCTLFFFACKKKDDGGSPADQLPPYSESGANTFGCLVDGKAFVPKKNAGSMSVPLQCYYQYVDNIQYFGIRGTDFVNNYNVVIGSSGIIITSDTVFKILSPGIGHVSAGCGNLNSSTLQYNTKDTAGAELHIKHVDWQSQIVSGTFWFDAVDTVANKTVHITDGRFDLHFTR